MKRRAHTLITLGCFAIIIISFVNFSLAKTVKGKKSTSKVDSDVDEPKDCARIHSRCCRLRIKCIPESKKKDCLKPLCSELACKEKKCGDVCKVSYVKYSGKCWTMKNGKNKCMLARNKKKHPICGKKAECRTSAQCNKGKRKKDKKLRRRCINGKCRSSPSKPKKPMPVTDPTEPPLRMIGRPFVVNGKYRSSASLMEQIDESNAKTEWNIDQVPRILANSSSNQAIAIEFLNQGEGEHASVASFARHTLQLMSMGAPTTMLIGSQKAALDEIKHAKMCYGIAKSFLEAKIQPSTLNIDGSVTKISNSEIIQSVITEGCIGETVAAVRAQLSVHYAKEPNIKSILQEIASDETNHSQLAWNTVQWAINRFPELRVIAEETFKAQLDRPIDMAKGLPTNYCYDCEKESALRDHGLLLHTDKGITENLGIQNVIEPVILNEFLNVDTVSTQILNMDFSKYQ